MDKNGGVVKKRSEESEHIFQGPRITHQGPCQQNKMAKTYRQVKCRKDVKASAVEETSRQEIKRKPNKKVV